MILEYDNQVHNTIFCIMKKNLSKLQNKILKFIYGLKKKYFYYESFNLFKNFVAPPKIIGYQLSRNTKLGNKGDIIYLPPDIQNSWFVMNSGELGYNYMNYIPDEKKKSNEYVFIDIGANVGLSTREMMKENINIVSYVCVEPVKTNYECLKLNLGNFKNVDLYNFGLSDVETRQDIFIDSGNHGNSSLLETMMVHSKHNEYVISSVDIKTVKQFFNLIKDKITDKQLIIKIDVQGYDELIFSLIPEEILEKTDLLIYELTLHQKIKNPDFDIDSFKKNLSKFNKLDSDTISIRSFDDLIKITANRNNGKKLETDIYLQK